MLIKNSFIRIIISHQISGGIQGGKKRKEKKREKTDCLLNYILMLHLKFEYFEAH